MSGERLMRKYKYFIFDLDGTLVDTGPAIIAALQMMQEREGLKRLDVETLRRFIGPALKESLCKYYGVSMEETDHLTQVYRACALEVGLEKNTVFDHVEAYLSHIIQKGGMSAVASLKQAPIPDAILKDKGLDKYFDHICLNWENAVGDKAAMIRECLSHMGAKDHREAVMIGDSPSDGRAAAEAGVDFVAFTYGDGFSFENSLFGIEHVFNARSPQELRDFIFAAI